MKKLILLLFVCCLVVQESQSQNKDIYTIRNIEINNKLSNFGTSYFGNDKIVFASPRKKSFIINNTWKPNGQGYLDLFVGDMMENGEIENVKKLSNKLNSKWHEANVVFSKDLRTAYFTRSNYFKGKYRKDKNGINNLKMFKATINSKGAWINITSVHFNSDEYSVGHPALSPDGKTMYFVSDMPGTIGGTDIFKVDVYSNGSLGAPVNLGGIINTLGKEMFPFISETGVLYFSSDKRKEGLGGLDIYQVAIGSSETPVNLGSPINSVKDDFAFIVNNTDKNGYFSSNRLGGKGDDDIYFFKLEKVIEAVKEMKCQQLVTGLVLDKNSKNRIPNATIEIIRKGKSIETITSDERAKFSFKADCSSEYKLEASKDTYESNTIVFDTSKDSDSQLVLNIELEKKLHGFVISDDTIKIKINPIYFDLNKFEIRDDAAYELIKVIAIMKKYPGLIVEGGSHTDSRGSDSYNKKLSTRRAQSTVDYIVSHGIASYRIIARGYGESRLVNNCSNKVKCENYEHQLNRRTEFVVLNPEILNR
ncbi:MAG: flagellar motor protein MotB [Flavobacteriaceae bacterium]|nr:MAG: flagellar motor protein MotB [Flavobacteriaceae bacterium]